MPRSIKGTLFKAGYFKKLFTVTVLLLPAVFVNADSMLFLFDGSLDSSYYRMKDAGDGDLGINGSLSPAMLWEFGGNRTLSAYYDLSYDETGRAIEDEGIRWADRSLGQFLAFGYTHPVSDKTENRLTLLGYYEFTRGTRDETLAGGLYNFYDAGLKDEVTTYTSFMDKPAYLKNGVQLYFRGFPNYEGLYYQIYDEGPRWEKDYYAGKLWTGAEVFWDENLKSDFKVAYLFKVFRDDLIMIEPESGDSYPYSDGRRIEHVANLAAGVSRMVSPRINAGLNLDAEFRLGNQNLYDSARLTFISGVYDYQQYILTPVINAKPWKELTAGLAYDIRYRRYFSNLALNETGNYKDEKLYRLVHSLTLNLSYPIYKEFTARLKANWSLSTSNNEYERAEGYKYESFNLGIGLGYEF